MTPDEFDEIDALNRLIKLPAPTASRLETVQTNAVLIDGAGNTRSINVPDYRPEYLIPIPDTDLRRWLRPPDSVPTKTTIRVAVFRLSSVQIGKAVYRLDRIDER